MALVEYHETNAKPKYKVGDKVYLKGETDKPREITKVFLHRMDKWDSDFSYALKGEAQDVPHPEPWLVPAKSSSGKKSSSGTRTRSDSGNYYVNNVAYKSAAEAYETLAPKYGVKIPTYSYNARLKMETLARKHNLTIR